MPAGEMLARLRAVFTPNEVSRVRAACRIAEEAFTYGAKDVRDGLPETEVAALFRASLSTVGTGFEGVERADGFTFCLSGGNSVEAFAAYQRSRPRELRAGDIALVHCHSYAGGYWTDISRTFSIGEPDGRKRKMYEAVFAARPRLHPESGDVLETGMVFNIEPAIYIEAQGGLRPCDMVVVTKIGCECWPPSDIRQKMLTEATS